MGRVLITRPLIEGGTDPLIESGHEIVAPPTALTAEDLIDYAAECDGIVSHLTDRIDSSVLESGSKGGRLRVVANAAVGYDNIDVAAANAGGITICNTPGVLDDTTADLAFLLILATRRQATEAESDLREGRWRGWGFGDHLAHDVHGATLGLVGFGRIGSAVAHRAGAFGMDVRHHARHPTGVPGYEDELDALLGTSDAVSLHVPLTPQTHHLLDARRLSLLPPGAVVINTARGPVLDEAALVAALREGRIAGAGLDVYDDEPHVSERLRSAPNAVLTPHIGSATRETRAAMCEMAVDAVVDVLEGRTPPHRVAGASSPPPE